MHYGTEARSKANTIQIGQPRTVLFSSLPHLIIINWGRVFFAALISLQEEHREVSLTYRKSPHKKDSAKAVKGHLYNIKIILMLLGSENKLHFKNNISVINILFI